MRSEAFLDQGTTMRDDAYLSNELDEIFASKLVESREFRSWFLSRSKFARLWPLARLLRDEQEAASGKGPWWRNTGATKMLYIFEVEQTRLRFALHVARAGRAEELAAYDDGAPRRLALAMMHQERFLNHMDFETVLLAPQALIADDARTLNFDRRIPFETVAGFLPQFGRPHLRVAA
jgi:hypothetical protein